MPDESITADEFRKRLAQLCTTGRSSDLPRKPRDRSIVLKSIALTLEPGRVYSEMDLKTALTAWSGAVGNTMQVDHAALRRNLIDEKYLSRSADGRMYELIADTNAALFAPEISAIDQSAVVNDAILEAAAKREAFRNKQP
ncbi:MAG: DUF2087 domain-containing protein [Acidobacteria bacterium]|nr:DUF2087 domain-containing protein [Acidobacteriota bacterium]